MTFGQPLRQAYSVEHLLLCIDVNVQSAKRKAPIIIIPSRRHCCLYVLYVLYHLPTALSLSSYKQNQHKLPTCSWPLTHSLRLIRSLHLEKQPPHIDASSHLHLHSLLPNPHPPPLNLISQLKIYRTSLHRPSCCERQT